MKFNIYNTMLDEDKKNILVAENTLYYAGDDNLSYPFNISLFMKVMFQLDRKAEEFVYILAFDTKFNLLGVFEISHGTNNMSLASPREILIRALLCGASNIVMVHNHPSGYIKPSADDLNVTERVYKACKVVGVYLKDHIIIGSSDDYFSFKEKELLNY